MGAVHLNGVMVLIGSLCAACSSGSSGNRVVDPNVGRACLPEPELNPTFGGFGRGEVNLTQGSGQCGAGVCLVNHFQGRVSCPQGQTWDAAFNASRSCLVPGTTDQVRAPVSPQLVDRRDTQAVYCSCRCDGTESSATYCQCPSGMHCQAVMPDYEVGLSNIAGSYCVKDGTDDDGQNQATCTACSTTQLPVPQAASTVHYVSIINQLPIEVVPSTGIVTVGCLPRPLTTNSPVPRCAVVLAKDASAASCEVLLASGDPLGEDVRSRLRDDGLCDTASTPACQTVHLCRVDPASGTADVGTCAQDVTVTTPDYCSCLNDPQSTVAGYCYIDSSVGNQDFVGDCPQTQRRTVRIPRLDALLAAYVACQDGV